MTAPDNPNPPSSPATLSVKEGEPEWWSYDVTSIYRGKVWLGDARNTGAAKAIVESANSLIRILESTLSVKEAHPKEEEGLGEKDAERPATAPRPMECEDSVIALIQRRRERGRAKYGQTMERHDLTMQEWLTHAQEEALDFAIYLEAIMRRTGEEPEPKRYPCARCGALRTEAEGGTTFTVCDECWDSRADSSVPAGLKSDHGSEYPKTSVEAHPEGKEGKKPVDDWRDDPDKVREQAEFTADVLAARKKEPDVSADNAARTEQPSAGSRFTRVAPGITLGCITPEASDLLERAMEEWGKFEAELKGNIGSDYEPSIYQFAYWLIRWSGLVAPSVGAGTKSGSGPGSAEGESSPKSSSVPCSEERL